MRSGKIKVLVSGLVGVVIMGMSPVMPVFAAQSIASQSMPTIIHNSGSDLALQPKARQRQSSNNTKQRSSSKKLAKNTKKRATKIKKHKTSGVSKQKKSQKTKTQPEKFCTNAQLCPATAVSPIIINEILPRPHRGSQERFIELSNTSAKAVDLAGWWLGTPRKHHSLSGSIAAHEIKAYPQTMTHLQLKNNHDEVYLYNKPEVIVDHVGYAAAPIGKSYNLDDKGKWHWSSTITPGAPNKIASSLDNNKKADSALHASAYPGKSTTSTTSIAKKSTHKKVALTHKTTRNLKPTASATLAVPVNYKPAAVDIANDDSETADDNDYDSRTLMSGHLTAPQGHIAIVAKSEVSIDPNNNDNEIIDDETADDLGTPNSQTLDKPEKYDIGLEESTIRASVKNKSTATVPRDAVKSHTTKSHAVNKIAGKKVARKKAAKKTTSRSGSNVARSKSSKTIKHPVRAKRVHAAGIATKKRALLNQTPISLTIAEARAQEKGTVVKVTGVVSVVPETFGSGTFNITDGQAGLKVFSNHEKIPALSLGNKISAAGTISELRGAKRLALKNYEPLKIIEVGQPPIARRTTLTAITENDVDNLIAVSGEVTKVKNYQMYIDDGEGEAAVSLKKETRADQGIIKEGDSVDVIGLLEQDKNGWQIKPRGSEDIVVTGHRQVAGNATSTMSGSITGSAKPYMAIGLTSAGVIGGVWAAAKKGWFEPIKKAFRKGV